MTISNNYPTIRPTLLLDFANTESLDPRITFSRPTTGTYYDGKTTVVAEQNLIQQSQTFENAKWQKYLSTITANTTVAPDGTTTAETFTSTTSGNTSNYVYQDGYGTLTNPTISVYAKAGTATFLSITNYTTSQYLGYATFDLSAGTVADSSNGTASIVSVGSGWYRCILSLSVVSTGFYFQGKNANPAGQPYSTGTWTSGTDLYLWGAQLEQRSTVTAYTATTTTAITNYIPVLLSAPSNEARFQHNPVTGESLGLLIEDLRTNLVLRSEEFNNGYWDVKSNSSITANTIISPSGTLTGSKLVESTANGQHWVGSSTGSSGITITSGVSYTVSVYAKQGERGYLSLNGDAGSGRLGGISVFNLTDGTVYSVGASNTASITSVGNGWYRCAVTATASSTGIGYPYIGLRQNSDPSNGSYTGNGWNGLYIWGAQFEAAAYATSYIPTTVSQVTRSADSASMTGTNFSSWYNFQQGSFYTEFSSYFYSAANFQNVIGCVKNTAPTGNAVGLIVLSGRNYCSTFFNGTATAAQVYVTPAANTFYKMGMTYSSLNVTGAWNGATVTTSASNAPPPDLDTLYFMGQRNGATAFFNNGTIKKLSYYPIQVTSTNLVALTGS